MIYAIYFVRVLQVNHYTAFQIALESGHTSVVELLVSSGAELNALDNVSTLITAIAAYFILFIYFCACKIFTLTFIHVSYFIEFEYMSSSFRQFIWLQGLVMLQYWSYSYRKGWILIHKSL